MIPLPIFYTEIEEIYTRTLGAGCRKIAITAADDKEGVSSIAYSLARRSAAVGRKTLLVDFNQRRPSVGQRLAISAKDWRPGDASALENIVPLSATGLAILPAPSTDYKWLHARETTILTECFEQWQEHYDCIIADTSPLTIRNQENFPPENVCRVCDGTVLVVLTGKTPETKVIEALGKLSGANARVIGTILNDRYAPTLADELARETERLNRVLPGFMEKIRGVIRRSTFFNQPI